MGKAEQAELAMKVDGKMRFRMILAAEGDGEEARWYSARETMPEDLRQRCDEALCGPHTATFVIADEGAEEKLLEAGKPMEKPNPPKRPGLDPRLLVDLSILGLVGLGLWCLATLR